MPVFMTVNGEINYFETYFDAKYVYFTAKLYQFFRK